MLASPSLSGTSLLEEVEARVRRTTYGRIRNLKVEDVDGRVVVRGCVPSRHTKQLALYAALELLSGDRFRECITIG
jgi:hypothetical protein